MDIYIFLSYLCACCLGFFFQFGCNAFSLGATAHQDSRPGVPSGESAGRPQPPAQQDSRHKAGVAQAQGELFHLIRIFFRKMLGMRSDGIFLM